MKYAVTNENTSVGDILICVRATDMIPLYSEYSVTKLYAEAFVLYGAYYFKFIGQNMENRHTTIFAHKKLLSETDLFLYKLSGRLDCA